MPDSLRKRPFRGSEVIRAGLLTRAQLKSGCWVRLFPDVYLYREVEITHLETCRALALAMPVGAAVSGASAAYLHGADVLGHDELAEITIPPSSRMRARRGVAVRHARLSPEDIIRRAAVPTTTAVRTAFDLARWREPEDEAVVAVDALLTKCRFTVEEIGAYADTQLHPRLTTKVGRVLDLAMPGAESPMETRLRLVLVNAGLPRPNLQHEISDPYGPFVARLDLAYTEARLGIEYDGGGHFDPEQVKKDLARQNALRAAGWSLLRFTYDDVMRRPARLLAQVCSALRG